MNLYVARNGEVLGPHTDEQTREYLKAGILDPDELAAARAKKTGSRSRAFLPRSPVA